MGPRGLQCQPLAIRSAAAVVMLRNSSRLKDRTSNGLGLPDIMRAEAQEGRQCPRSIVRPAAPMASPRSRPSA